jgi:hypothetical protein
MLVAVTWWTAAAADRAPPVTAQQQVDEHGLYGFADVGARTAFFSWSTSRGALRALTVHLRGARLVAGAAPSRRAVGLLSVIRAARPGPAKPGRRYALVMPRRAPRERVVLRASRPRVVLRVSSGASDRVLLIVSDLPTDVSDMDMRLTAASNGLLRLSAPCPTDLVARAGFTRTGAPAATTTSSVRC